jgi:O-acetyl-ADP-ribose deacetylase
VHEARLSYITGDITKMEVDAVVNAANSSLMGGGGVDGAIHARGGRAILDECKAIRASQYPDGLPAGEAVPTTAGNLCARHVIHTVGPVWRGGTKGEAAVLASAYRSCLAVASSIRSKSVAFPAISTGAYGFPKELAAKIAFRTVMAHLDTDTFPQRVYLVFFKESDLKIFSEAISAVDAGAGAPDVP